MVLGPICAVGPKRDISAGRSTANLSRSAPIRIGSVRNGEALTPHAEIRHTGSCLGSSHNIVCPHRELSRGQVDVTRLPRARGSLPFHVVGNVPCRLDQNARADKAANLGEPRILAELKCGHSDQFLEHILERDSRKVEEGRHIAYAAGTIRRVHGRKLSNAPACQEHDPPKPGLGASPNLPKREGQQHTRKDKQTRQAFELGFAHRGILGCVVHTTIPWAPKVVGKLFEGGPKGIRLEVRRVQDENDTCALIEALPVGGGVGGLGRERCGCDDQ